MADWTSAIERGDRDALLAAHAETVVMIDVPNVVRGIEAYARTWDFFDASRRGAVTFIPHNIEVTAGGAVGFAHGEVHGDGTTAGPIDCRLTVGLVKIDGDWIITHEHHSMPTRDSTLIGPNAAR